METRRVPQRKDSSSVEDLILALSDKRVSDIIAGIFEQKLNPILQSLSEVLEKNKTLEKDVSKLQGELAAANAKINHLENFTRLDNLIITGLPLIDYSDAASTSANRDAVETSASTERAVLNFFNTTLNVPVESKDISIAHRLKSTAAQSLPNIIVRFSNRKARNDVYAARRRLQRSERRHDEQAIYINEDLTKETASIFKQAREMVRRKILHRCWTGGGFVYVKKTETTPVPVKIVKPEDLRTL